jgi:hypothetical protein
MRRASLILLLTIAVVAIVPVVSQLGSAQDRSKQGTRPEKTVPRQLHPEPVESDPPKGIRLLAGYKHKSATDFEGNQVGDISKSDGVKIKYEIGFSQGMAADPDQKAAYVWYREQNFSGRTIRYALRKDNMLMISVPLEVAPNTLHAANFYGTIRKQNDIADMLLMILPFAYN